MFTGGRDVNTGEEFRNVEFYYGAMDLLVAAGTGRRSRRFAYQ